MSKVRAFYHIVINTKGRRATIPMHLRRELYSYIHGIILHHSCKTIRINGVENHVHILMKLHSSVALSDIVADIKRSSTLWMRNNPGFSGFEYWGKEYFAETISYDTIEVVKTYIINQEEHHLHAGFEEEMRLWTRRLGIEWKDTILT